MSGPPVRDPLSRNWRSSLPSRDLVIDGYNFIFRLARDAEFRPGEIQRLRTELEAAVSAYGRSREMRPWIVWR